MNRKFSFLFLGVFLAGCVAAPLTTNPAPGSVVPPASPVASDQAGMATPLAPVPSGAVPATAAADDDFSSYVEPPLPGFDPATHQLGMTISLPSSLFVPYRSSFQVLQSSPLTYNRVREGIRQRLKDPAKYTRWNRDAGLVAKAAFEILYRKDPNHRLLVTKFEDRAASLLLSATKGVSPQKFPINSPAFTTKAQKVALLLLNGLEREAAKSLLTVTVSASIGSTPATTPEPTKTAPERADDADSAMQTQSASLTTQQFLDDPEPIVTILPSMLDLSGIQSDDLTSADQSVVVMATAVTLPIDATYISVVSSVALAEQATDDCRPSNQPQYVRVNVSLPNGDVVATSLVDLANLTGPTPLDSTSTAREMLAIRQAQAQVFNLSPDYVRYVGGRTPAFQAAQQLPHALLTGCSPEGQRAVSLLSDVIVSSQNASNPGSVTQNSRVQQTATWLSRALDQNIPADQMGSFVQTAQQQQATANGGGGGAAAATPLKKIAFQANRDGNAEIYVMNSDGTNQTRLTTNAVTDSDPDWSPDGSKIAWISNNNVWVMNADGSNPVQLTNTAQVESTPRWSPTGNKILYVSERDTPGFGEIYVMDAVDGNNDQEGDNRKRLTSNGVADYWPRWSPNGNRFAFVANTGTAPGLAEIYVGDPVDADNNNVGDNMIRLTNNNSDDLVPNWSPDGTKLVFRALRHGIAEIYRMDADGNNPLRLTSLGVNTDWPMYAPNGSRVAYLTFVNPTNQIAVMDPADTNNDGAGDNYLQLTTAGGDFPRISPDGSKVLVYNAGDLWVYPITGGAGTQLTSAAGNDTQAAWQP